MKYNILGKTGLTVSEVSFGSSSLAGVFHPVSEQEAISAVSQALDIGINYFDTAPLYGNTLAESRLGKALQSIPRDSYILATKTGRYHNDEFDFSAARVNSSFAESCRRLKTDYIDIFQAHDIEHTSQEQLLNETLPALETLKNQGKVRYIGITGLDLNTLVNIANAYSIDTLLSFCRCSIVDDRLSEATQQLEDKSIGIINASPFSMGLLTLRGPIDWHPATKVMREKALEAKQYCERYHKDFEKTVFQSSIRQASEIKTSTTLAGSGVAEHIRQWRDWLTCSPDTKIEEKLSEILSPIKNSDW